MVIGEELVIFNCCHPEQARLQRQVLMSVMREISVSPGLCAESQFTSEGMQINPAQLSPYKQADRETRPSIIVQTHYTSLSLGVCPMLTPNHLVMRTESYGLEKNTKRNINDRLK